jgi:hypothetical protein
MQPSRSLSILIVVVLTTLLPPSCADAETYGSIAHHHDPPSSLDTTAPRRLFDVSDCEGSGSDALCVNADIDATGALLGCSVSYGGSNCTCALCTTSGGKGGFSYDCSQVSASTAEGSNGTSTSGGTGPTMGCMEFSEHAGGTPTSSAPPTVWPIGMLLCVALATVGLESWLR